MRKEFRAYFLNIIKKESFYIDVLSILAGVAIIALTAVAFFTVNRALLKAVFSVALFLTLINSHKGFREGTPTKMLYLALSVVLLGVCIYSYIVI